MTKDKKEFQPTFKKCRATQYCCVFCRLGVEHNGSIKDGELLVCQWCFEKKGLKETY